MSIETIKVDKGDYIYTVTVRRVEQTTGTCVCCGRPTRRSRYGVLHKDCARCRYMKMIFGPSIRVMVED